MNTGSVKPSEIRGGRRRTDEGSLQKSLSEGMDSCPRTAVLQKTLHCSRYHSDMQQKDNPNFMNVTGEILNKPARTTRRPSTPGIQTPVQRTCARGTQARTRFRVGPAVVSRDSSIRITMCPRTIARCSQRQSLRCRGCRCGERRNSLS